MLGWLILALIGLVALFLFSSADGAAILANPDHAFYVSLTAGVLGVYALWLLASQRDRLAQALVSLLLWAGIGLGFVAAYAYRDEFNLVAGRVAEELLPQTQVAIEEPGASGKKAVRIRGRGDGHFVVRAKVNGSNTSMLVDTGASAVVLTPNDARRAGIDLKRLSFTVPVSTANGLSYAAPARLKSISIGGIVVRDVEALVAKPGSLRENLLGMSFLRRLGSYEFSKNFLTMRS